MKAPNRFLYFANPAQWAKFFRKEQISKRFYKFTYHKVGSADTLQISINGKDYVEIADGESFKLHTNDTLKYKFGDSLEDSYTFECFVGDTETAANVFSVPGETSLVNTFRPANCTQETTKISGTITKDTFKALPSGTELSFKAKALETPKYFNVQINYLSYMGYTSGVPIKRNEETSYTNYLDGSTLVFNLNDKIVFQKPGGAASVPAYITIYKEAEHTTEVAVLKINDDGQLHSKFYDDSQASDNYAQLVSESFTEEYPSGTTLYAFVDM